MKFVEIHELPESSPLTRQYHKVRHVRTQSGYDVVFLCVRPLIIATHYDAQLGRTIACVGLDDGCQLCRKGVQARPKIYAPAQERVTNDQFVQEVTESAFRDIEAAIGKGGSWRGLGVNLSRAGKHANAKVCAKILGRRAEATLLPEFDPKPHLGRLFEGTGIPRKHEQKPTQPNDQETQGL